MNREQLDIMHHTVELSFTIYQGLQYVGSQLDAGMFEDSYEIMGSVFSGMDVIKKALPGVINSLPRTNLGYSTLELRDIFEAVRKSYQEGEAGLAHVTVREILIPAFENWQDEVNSEFKPFLCH